MDSIANNLMSIIRVNGNRAGAGYVVDDICENHTYSNRYPGSVLVRLQRIGKLHSVKHLLFKKELVEREYQTFVKDTDSDSNLIAFGRSFTVNDELYADYYEHHKDQGSMLYIDEFTSIEMERNREIEKSIYDFKVALVDRIQANEYVGKATSLTNKQPVRVSTFKVGQGDTLLVEFEDQTFWMIDSFMPSTCTIHEVDNHIDTLLSRGYSFETLILSHMHYDHIKNAHAMIHKYGPSNVVVADLPHKLTYTAVVTLEFAELRSNLVMLNCLTKCKNDIVTLYPTNIVGLDMGIADPNTHGIITFIETADSQMILSGDVRGEQLAYLVSNYVKPDENKRRYYKVTHHCSRTGDSQIFMGLYHPHEAITSCGWGNGYGHPDDPPLSVLNQIANHIITFTLTVPNHTYIL